MIIPHYYEDPHMLHENTMPNRAYLCSSIKADGQSDRTQRTVRSSAIVKW